MPIFRLIDNEHETSFEKLLINLDEFFWKYAAGGISVASLVVKKTTDIMMNQTRAKPRGNDRVLVIGQPGSIHTERFVGALRQRNPEKTHVVKATIFKQAQR